MRKLRILLEAGILLVLLVAALWVVKVPAAAANRLTDVIEGYAGSTEETYAKEHRFRFHNLTTGQVKKWDYLPEQAVIQKVVAGNAGDVTVTIRNLVDSKAPTGLVVAVRAEGEKYSFYDVPETKDGELPQITVTGLGAGVHYVRARAYWQGKTRRYYGKWSARKKIDVPVPEQTAGGDGEMTEGKQFPEAMTDFAVDFLKMEAGTALSSGKNLMVSPYSLMAALGMTANGMAGETKAEFEKMAGMPVEDGLNEAMQSYREMVTAEPADAGDATFHEANAIWYKDAEELVMRETFLEKVKTYYDADVRKTAFDDAAVKEVNGWVKQLTDGMIEKLVDSFDKDTMALLVNALAFEGKWEETYEEYDIREGRTFRNAKGEEEEVTMLSDTPSSYVTLNGALGFTKSYAGGKFAFLALLPEEGTDVGDYVAGLSGEDFREALLHPHYGADVYTEMPEFKFDYESSLVKTLQEMGLRTVFSPDQADLSEMAVLPLPDGGNLYVSDVLQKTHIELDREGTKAAAVTAVIVNKTTAFMPRENVEILLNRPFVFAIIDQEQKLPVFIGVLQTVK